MKKLFLAIVICIMSCGMVTLAFSLSHEGNLNLSELTLLNIEALADYELPDVIVTCSRSPNDGVGQCYKNMLYPWYPDCQYTGYQYDFCSYATWV